MINHGGNREGAGKKSSWGFPTSDLKVKRLPYQVINVLEQVQKKYQGDELLDALMSLVNDSTKVTHSIDNVTQSMVIPVLKKHICELINVSEKTADRRIRKAKQALGITGAITPERQAERFQVVQYILNS